jgi:hypothetical protein
MEYIRQDVWAGGQLESFNHEAHSRLLSHHQVIAALESWAKPIKDAALRAIEGNQATSASQVMNNTNSTCWDHCSWLFGSGSATRAFIHKHYVQPPLSLVATHV